MVTVPDEADRTTTLPSPSSDKPESWAAINHIIKAASSPGSPKMQAINPIKAEPTSMTRARQCATKSDKQGLYQYNMTLGLRVQYTRCVRFGGNRCRV